MTTKVRHLNLATMCPVGGRLVSGAAGDPAELVVHALLVETSQGLVLVDTGFGLADVRDARRRLGAPLVWACQLALRDEDTAIRQLETLGLAATDVRHIVVTHLDPDHAGGLSDFPHAQVHIHRREHEAALHPPTFAERRRYRSAQLAHGPKWCVHEESGDTWNGFASVRAITDDVLLLPLFGHSRGHSAVAVRTAASSADEPEWILHAGDAYFFHGELDEPPTCPAGLAFFQRAAATDYAARCANLARLKDLRRDHGARVRIVSSHSPHEYRAVTSSRT
jgi:glyoxylase-like metal-dependent hydrolase (beta-lactamase superfamily II)